MPLAGGVFLAITVPFAFAPLAGHLADRVRRKPLLIATNAVTAVIVLALLTVRSREQLWIIYLVAFCYGASSAFSARPGPGCARTCSAAATSRPPTPRCPA